MTTTTSIAEELLAIVDTVGHRISLPPVKQVWLPPTRDRPEKSAEFGAVVLADDSVGVAYVLLGDTLTQLRDRGSPAAAVGLDPVELAQGFRGGDPATQALGLGAINAISQHVIRASGFPVDTETNSIASFDPQPEDRIGMVGFFPPLVAKLVAQNIDLTVIELKEELVRQESRFRVTLDPQALRQCNKILCTSTILLNDAIDAILGYCDHAEQVAVIGPSAGFLPDPLFTRGINTVGGHQVTDTPAFLARCEAEQRWGNTSQKYCFHRRSYPGYRALLASIR